MKNLEVKDIILLFFMVIDLILTIGIAFPPPLEPEIVNTVMKTWFGLNVVIGLVVMKLYGIQKPKESGDE